MPFITVAKQMALTGKAQLRLYMFECPTPENQWPPEYVTVMSDTGVIPSNLLRVVIPKVPSWPSDHCVCAGLYKGDPDLYRIIEWMEYYKLWFVKEFHIYDFALLPEVLRILQHYVTLNFVRIHHISHYKHNETMAKKVQESLLTTLAMNDCIYRNMYSCQHITLQPPFSLVTPRADIDFIDMVTSMNLDTVGGNRYPVSYQFPSGYFYLDMEMVEEQPESLLTPRYRRRVIKSSYQDAATTMTKPLACLFVELYTCIKVRHKYGRKNWKQDVDPEIGTAYFYKNCKSDMKEGVVQGCDVDMKNWTLDDTLMRFTDDVSSAAVETAWSTSLLDMTDTGEVYMAYRANNDSPGRHMDESTKAKLNEILNRLGKGSNSTIKNAGKAGNETVRKSDHGTTKLNFVRNIMNTTNQFNYKNSITASTMAGTNSSNLVTVKPKSHDPTKIINKFDSRNHTANQSIEWSSPGMCGCCNFWKFCLSLYRNC